MRVRPRAESVHDHFVRASVCIEQGKAVLVYRSTTREFLQIKSIQELEPLLDTCPPDVVEYLNKKINLEERVRTAAAQPSLGF